MEEAATGERIDAWKGEGEMMGSGQSRNESSLMTLLSLFGPVGGPAQLQSLVYALQETGHLPTDYSFSWNTNLPVSAELIDDLHSLLERGLVKDTGGPHSLVLTDKGQRKLEGQSSFLGLAVKRLDLNHIRMTAALVFLSKREGTADPTELSCLAEDYFLVRNTGQAIRNFSLLAPGAA